MVRHILSLLSLLLAISLCCARTVMEPATAVLIEQGHFKRAKAALSGSLQGNPNDANAHFEMSKVCVAYLQGDQAIMHAEKAIEADNKNSDFHTQLAEAIAAKLVSSDTGFFEKVPLVSRFKDEIDQALQLNAKNTRTAADLVQFYISAPALLGGSKDKAREIATQLVQWDPLDGNLIMAKVASADGIKQEEIQKLLQKAVAAGPKSYDAHITLADFYLKANNSKLAEEYATKASRIDPQRVRAYSILAMVYTERGDWTQLDSILAQSERNIPDDLSPFFQSARIMILADTKGQFARAEKFLRKYLSQEPEALQPTWSRAHWRLGQVLQKEGRRDDAKMEFQLALQLEPGLKEAQQDLKQVQ